MVLLLGEIAKAKLIAKIKESHSYACLMYALFNLPLSDIMTLEIEISTNNVGNTCHVFGESDTTSGDVTSILFFWILKNALGNRVVLSIAELVGFCSDGASVMIWRNIGVVAGFKKLDDSFNMFSVHVECHVIALAYNDTGDDLKFLSNSKTTMI